MKETLHYLGYTKNIGKEKSMADREKDILIENMQNQKNAEYLKNRNYFHQQRDEFNKVNSRICLILCRDFSFKFSRVFMKNVGNKLRIEVINCYEKKTKKLMKSLRLTKSTQTIRIWRVSCLERKRIFGYNMVMS